MYLQDGQEPEELISGRSGIKYPTRSSIIIGPGNHFKLEARPSKITKILYIGIIYQPNSENISFNIFYPVPH